jgi:hypothetical protein
LPERLAGLPVVLIDRGEIDVDRRRARVRTPSTFVRLDLSDPGVADVVRNEMLNGPIVHASKQRGEGAPAMRAWIERSIDEAPDVRSWQGLPRLLDRWVQQQCAHHGQTPSPERRVDPERYRGIKEALAQAEKSVPGLAPPELYDTKWLTAGAP